MKGKNQIKAHIALFLENSCALSKMQNGLCLRLGDGSSKFILYVTLPHVMMSFHSSLLLSPFTVTFYLERMYWFSRETHHVMLIKNAND